MTAIPTLFQNTQRTITDSTPQDKCRKEAQEDTAGQPVSTALSISVLLPIALCSDTDLLSFRVAKHLFPWRSTTITTFVHKPRVDYQLRIECTHLTRMRTTAILLSDRARSKSNKEPTIEQINKNTSKLRNRYKNQICIRDGPEYIWDGAKGSLFLFSYPSPVFSH